jgi:heptosyltransferase I
MNGWKRTFMSVKNGNHNRHHPERASSILKLLDRSAGIPLVFLLGLFRKKRHLGPRRAVRRIACLHTAAIGDTIISSALVQDLKQDFPEAEITFFTGASNYDTACLIPNIDAVMKLPIKAPFQAIGMIRRAGRFDLWLDLGPWPRLNALFSFSAHARFTAGFRTEGQYRHYGYDAAVRHEQHRHEVDNYRSLLEGIGIESRRNMPRLAVAACSSPRREAVVHMFPGGSRSWLKEWPEERWSELIGLLVKDGFTVTLTGTGQNREQALNVRARVPGKDQVTVAAGTADLRQTARILACSQLVISIDTGIMHMASALGCNLVSLHGPTVPERWGPLNANAVALTARDSCSPCLSLGFESNCRRPDCMLHLSVDQVHGAARRLLHY